MPDEQKNNKKLLQELEALHRQVAELEEAKTDLEKKEESLRKREERLGLLLQHMPAMIDAFDSNGNIIVWNRECEKVSGYGAAEIVGNSKAMELLYPDATCRERVMKELTTDSDRYRQWECKMTCKNGSVKTVLWSNISEQFPVLGWATWHIGMDITHLKQPAEILRLLGLEIDEAALKEPTEGMTKSQDLSEDKFLYPFFRAIAKREQAEESLRQSEIKYRTLLENLPQKIFLKDRHSVYVSCNENYSKDLKIKSEEIAGKTDYDFYPKGMAEKYRADDKRIMDSGKTEDIDENYIQDGQEVIVHTVKTPVRDARGNITGILGIFWDITEHKKAEEALKESELRFRTIFENAADGILLADVENKKFYIGNTIIYQMLGYNQEEIKTLRVMDIHPKEALPYVTEQFEKQLRKEISLAKDIAVKRKDGSVFYADINAFPIKLGGKTYLMGIFRNVTDRKKT